ncbi:hypothetical protein SShM2_108 [Synechococcus phage S-ShM2]|uniref:DUF6321 domain-containing protein n=3 Tax=Ahtivirus sagseatwo TaxID=2734079 RepID=A0A1D7SMH1_9CAUD|nr:hypothetical protein SShM2_108 [Synechococcus phage S-ShM2]AGH57447.1 hypothetical protein CPLG_00193 [Cyanophage S-SSM2]AOO13216.1 hypothetical protein LIS021110_102 [Cyanophage S-RIM14]ADO97719.1 hypothetical protein SShM2_108 [Synechococcus phage S-ShM2]AOO13432.1 hypothetical protein LIS110610_102 [Cyanophage S-RIM14]AOO13648.1 hypothetical protein Np111211_102 [Cyanophage S-RIM14]
MAAVSKKQQRFFGMVRAAQKGEGASSPEVAKVAANISKKDAKDYASTKHKGLPMKKKTYEEFVSECDTLRETTHVEEGAAWTKKSGKAKSGGLNEKGRKSYEKENPGSDLKAPSKKVGNPRRASFCARMKGMRKRQKPSNNTGDDRLSKSLRAWNC